MSTKTKEMIRGLIRLISILFVFAGMGLTILTAAGIEQDALTGRRLIAWMIISIGMMVIGGVINSWMERGEEDEFGRI